MPLEDFEAWWNNQDYRPDTAVARRAWLAAEEHMLHRDTGDQLPQVIARAILRGEAPGQLGALTDWLIEDGRFRPDVTNRNQELAAGLRMLLQAVRSLSFTPAQLEVLGVPVAHAADLLGLSQQNLDAEYATNVKPDRLKALADQIDAQPSWLPRFVLVWQQSLSVAEVASQLGLSRAAVSSRARRLRQNGVQLKRIWRQGRVDG
jgi:hypothetical protein